MKKRVLALFLTAVMLMVAAPVGHAADSDFVIDGSGELWRYNGPGGDVVIPQGVTRIHNCAFTHCDGLTGVTIPDGVTSIGDFAFAECVDLTRVTIPDGVTDIASCAFNGCSALTSLAIPDSVSSIGVSAFYGCSSLTDLTISNSLTTLEASVFSGCTALTHVTIPAGVTSIGDSAFNGCAALTDITIPDGVTSIGDFAFQNCGSLTSVTLPDRVTSIGSYAFSLCDGLTDITIPAGVRSIGNNAFWDDDKLSDVYYGGSEAQWDAITCAFYGDRAPVAFADGGQKEVELDGVTIHYNSDPAKPVSAFADVPADAWYAEAVTWAVGRNITQGTGDARFSPERQCTQAEIITFLWRAADSPKPTAPVTGNEFFAQAVQWAKERGIIDESFEASRPCTRQTAVTYLWRYADRPTGAPAASFRDMPADSDFAAAVNWAVQKGVAQGTGDGATFSPAVPCDRGQIVTFLRRAFG